MSGRSYFTRLSEDPRVLNSAWNEVHRNATSLSKGVDEKTLSAYAAHSQKNLTKLRLSLKNGFFEFSNLRGAALIKPNGKYRPIKIATIDDRIVQKAIEILIRNKLNDRYNLFNNPVSYAFIRTDDIKDYDASDPQSFKGVRGAIEKLKSYYSDDYSWCVKADIIDFFGNVDIQKLLDEYIYPALNPDDSLNDLIAKAFKQEVEISGSIKKLLDEQGIGEFEKFLKNNGLPQGSILSPMFSNVYLSGFDKEVSDEGMLVIRYVDDLLIVAKSKKEAIKAYEVIVSKLSKLSLKIHGINSDKTEITETSDVTFLGIRFKNGDFYPSEVAYEKMLEKLKKYPKYKTFIKNLQSLKMLTESWASTYFFCNSDEDAYSILNDELQFAVKRTLHKARLSPNVKLGSRELRRLGIYQFDNAIVKYNQGH